MTQMTTDLAQYSDAVVGLAARSDRRRVASLHLIGDYVHSQVRSSKNCSVRLIREPV